MSDEHNVQIELTASISSVSLSDSITEEIRAGLTGGVESPVNGLIRLLEAVAGAEHASEG